MTWLVNQVAGMYEDLNARVERDIEERDIQIEEAVNFAVTRC